MGQRSKIIFSIATCAAALCLGLPASSRADQANLSAAQLAAGDAAIESAAVPGQSTLTEADQKFLDDLERREVQFFVESADPVTGLMPDRAKADGSAPGKIASIASVGFGLTALCVGDYRGYISHQEAYEHCMRVLRFLRDRAPSKHGMFYHFLDMSSGERAWKSEVSNIDTALLMGGVLTVRQYFPGTELAAIANQLYENADWAWMLSPNGTLYMDWRPEHGFNKATWHDFNEGPLIYLMAMGSKTHPLSVRSWNAWKREPLETYAGLTFMQCPPLFTQQYPQVWFDLRGMRDDWADYFRNSQLATLAQRQWCIDDLSKQFPTYGPNMWGLTASDSANGYTAWGGPPQQGQPDGSVVPAAAAGSLAFEPRLCLDALENMRQHFGATGYQKFGFVDAFNPATGWCNPDVLGIDVGPSVLMAENCRSGFVWHMFMSSPEAQTALKVADFRPLTASDAVATTSLYNLAEKASAREAKPSVTAAGSGG